MEQSLIKCQMCDKIIYTPEAMSIHRPVCTHNRRLKLLELLLNTDRANSQFLSDEKLTELLRPVYEYVCMEYYVTGSCSESDDDSTESTDDSDTESTDSTDSTDDSDDSTGSSSDDTDSSWSTELQDDDFSNDFKDSFKGDFSRDFGDDTLSFSLGDGDLI